MKLSKRTIGVLVLVAILSTSVCGYINGIRAKSQLNDAVSAYKEKNYDVAEKYARKAMELDNNNENAWLDRPRSASAVPRHEHLRLDDRRGAIVRRAGRLRVGALGPARDRLRPTPQS